jgi:hypothetical protein
LRASEPAVVAAAARGVARAGLALDLVPELLGAMRSPSAAVAWETARALTLAGVRDPYREIQEGGPLAAVLGARGAELLVLAGDGTDIDVFELLIGGTPMTPELLSAVARFGDVTAWSFLAHHLTQPGLADAAVAALRTLFGSLVPKEEETSFSAWRRAIADAGLDPTTRYRAGRPWRPGTVLGECVSGALSRHEVERRVDELAARTRVHAHVDLSLWEHEARGSLATFSSEIEPHDARWHPGAWR